MSAKLSQKKVTLTKKRSVSNPSSGVKAKKVSVRKKNIRRYTRNLLLS
jgi:hypothetical protein